MASHRPIDNSRRSFGLARQLLVSALLIALASLNFSVSWADSSTQLDTPVIEQAQALTDTSFFIIFHRVSNDDGGYLVSLFLSSGTQVNGFTNTFSINEDGKEKDIVGGLSPSTSYTARIVAVGSSSKYSDSQKSPPISVTTQAVKAKITVTSTSGVVGTPLVLTTTGSVGSDPIVFEVQDGGSASGCTLASGSLSVASPGTCVITATQTNSDEYEEADSVATTITFVAASPRTPPPPLSQATLSISSTRGTVGVPLVLTTVGGSGGGAVTYSITGSGSASGCAISVNTLAVRTYGTCFITATKAADGTYAAGSSVQTAISFASLIQAPLTVMATPGYVGSPITVGTVGGSGNGVVTISVTNMLNVSGCALTGSALTATAAGFCKLRATKAGDGTYGPTTSTEVIVAILAPIPAPVTPAPVTPVASVIAPIHAEVASSKDTNVRVLVDVKASEPLEVSIDIPKGVTTEGSTVSIAPMTASVDAHTGSALISIKVISAAGVPETHFDRPLTLSIGKKTVASVPVYSEDGITWSLIALVPGTTLPDGWSEGYYIDDSGSVVILTHHLTIFGQKKIQGPVFAATSAPSLVAGTHVRVSGFGGTSTRPIVYSSISPGICTVSQWGVLVGLSAGQCQVVAKRRGDDAYMSKTSDPISIIVQKMPQRELHVATFLTSLTMGSLADLLIYGGSGKGLISYQSLTPMVCDVLSNGYVIPRMSGECALQARKRGTDVYLDSVSTPLTMLVR